MKIGVLGTGVVGQTVAGGLVRIGHEVRMGAREAGNEKARAWAVSAGARASHGTFADAATFGEIVFNCTNGANSLAALRSVGVDNLAGKPVVDVANPLDFSKGMPPTLTTAQGDSLAEQIQREFPHARVVKALNTVSSSLMVEPGKLSAETDLLICGNDAEAKKQVTGLLRDLGWKSILDLGDISAARGTEAYLLLWVRLYAALGTPQLNIRVVR